MKKLNTFFRKYWELGFVAVLVVFSALLHAQNMFHFPFFENDEGTYLAQAWSFLSDGKLAPYTYWYDHAPFGWIFTSLWVMLTGGLFTFGFSLNSGRVFMLVIHMFSTGLLYMLSKKVTNSKVAAVFAVVFFSVSPLAVYFQRRLLLDNLMIFWLLCSLCLILTSRSQLRNFILGAVTFGFAVLTKENAIFFLPVMLWLVMKRAHRNHRTIAVLKWLCITGVVISIYPLYALLKGELFPMGSIFSPPHPHVSLITTLLSQSARGSGLAFWKEGSDFRANLWYWQKEDYWFITAGLYAFLLHGVLAFKSKRSRLVFLLTLPQILFLCSGKLVINFYVVSVIPFLSLSIGLLVAQFYGQIRKISVVFAAYFLLIVGIILYNYYLPLSMGYLTKDETTPQLLAVDWIKQNVDPSADISIDFYSYLDLNNSRFSGDPAFKNADWFWKVELDPDVTEKKLGNDFANIEYVMVTAEAQRQIFNFPQEKSLLRKALSGSQIVQQFSSDQSFAQNFNLRNQTMPNGDWVVMYKQERSNLAKAWATYKRKFLPNGMYTQPPEQLDAVISEAQSYALLRAVWMNDKETFDSVYAWTKANMQLKNSKLFGWKWMTRTQRLIDEGNAPDADQDIALALLFAGQKWNDETYTKEATEIIKDIWEHNVFVDERIAVITGGNWAENTEFVTLNPSYIAPYAYREFAKVDPDHDWARLVGSSYEVLSKCSTSMLGKNYSTGLPPEWCEYEREGGAFVLSRVMGDGSEDYGYNAFRIPWKVYLDFQWNNEPRALTYLKSLDFLAWQHNQNSLVDVFSHDAVPQTQAQRYAYIMNLPVFIATNENVAQEILITKVKPSFIETETDAYWNEGDEYYFQNWAWFAAGIHQGQLTNLAK